MDGWIEIERDREKRVSLIGEMLTDRYTLKALYNTTNLFNSMIERENKNGQMDGQTEIERDNKI